MVWYGGWWVLGLIEPPVPGECCMVLSPANCGNAVMNSAMEGWLLIKPVSADPHVGSMAGWWVPCGGSPAGVPAPAATVASQKPPPPSFARTGVVGLVFTVDRSLPAWTKFWRWLFSRRLLESDSCGWCESSSARCLLLISACCLPRMEQYAPTCTWNWLLSLVINAVQLSNYLLRGNGYRREANLFPTSDDSSQYMGFGEHIIHINSLDKCFTSGFAHFPPFRRCVFVLKRRTAINRRNLSSQYLSLKIKESINLFT